MPQSMKSKAAKAIKESKAAKAMKDSKAVKAMKNSNVLKAMKECKTVKTMKEKAHKALSAQGKQAKTTKKEKAQEDLVAKVPWWLTSYGDDRVD